jgi:hypothetical protein
MSQDPSGYIWTVITAVIQIALSAVYLVVASSTFAFGQADVPGTYIETIIFFLILWVPVLGCIALSAWLHIKKKKRGLALLVFLLPPVILLLVYFAVGGR